MDTSGPTLRQRSSVPNSDHPPTSSTSSTNDPTSNIDIKSTDQASSILSSSVQGASYLVLLQFVSRMLTFTLNQVLLRFTSAETLGIASVQLELLLNTILFLSREGVRCAAIRVSDDSTEGEEGTTSSDNKGMEKMRLTPGSEAYRLQKLVNMVYAPIPVGALMTCLAVGYYLLQVTDASEGLFPGYRLSIYLYGISALVELLAEPMFMVAQYKLWFKTRVSVEGTAVIVRCVLTCALTVYGSRTAVTGSSSEGSNTNTNTMGVLAFAIAQFVYGLLTLGGFLLAFWSKSTERRDLDRKRMAAAIKKRDGIAVEDQPNSDDDTVSMSALLPRRLTRVGKDGQSESFYFDKELLKLSKTLTSQSLLKHILTEGDKMMMTKFADVTAQGVYAFVVNYGSLIARILFQPMEETSRTLFSRLLSDIAPGSTPSGNKDTNSEKTSNTTTPTSRTLTETQLDNLVLSRNLLLTIMKFHILLGLVFIAFGTHYTATLIDLVVGRYWSTVTKAPQVLSLYCYYVPIMGLNGITEAVVQAVASEKELGVLSYWMIGFSAVFCSTGAFLMGTLNLKAEGIVLANCVNLIMRIVWSMWFLSGYYGRYIPIAGKSSTTAKEGVLARFAYVPWQNIIPRPTVLVAFGAAFVLTATTEQWIGWEGLYNKAVHLGIGVAAFVVVMGVIFVTEKQFLRDIQSIVRQRRR
ncbi:Rft-1-domain-containing protein [Linnemannia elongata AG-77]|uniref:Man(5)GlcNAc(2)-PP-dolichol translocation protein RFT1 n=1 Tax=Linnemannia elongata AG-77 TaxID=1314771 RepID=A0A197K7N8_9FUNG|nr:Rft-1-domain-containing protein [Linnemannia elongata AG-77]